LIFPLFALAQASCYDYEYYDPGTGKSLPGNACAGQAAAGTTASVGQPQTSATIVGAGTTSPFVSAPAFGAPVASFASAPVYGSVGTTSFGAPVAQFASTPVYGSSLPSAVAVSSQVGYAAPVAASVQVQGGNGGNGAQLSQSELEYYKQLGVKQAKEHKQNKKVVDEAAQEIQRSSLVNTLVAGSTGTAFWYPAYRLGAQRDAAGAYKSESKIANKNANDAYQRYQQDPSRLNLLVSKYQDLNADLADAAYHYNVINSGTFGQVTTQASILGLGSLTGGLFGSLTQIITNRQQTQDLQDIQRQMQRISKQIQTEAKAEEQQQQSGASVAVVAQPAQVQGSVQQRMMAMSVYGPQRG